MQLPPCAVASEGIRPIIRALRTYTAVSAYARRYNEERTAVRAAAPPRARPRPRAAGAPPRVVHSAASQGGLSLRCESHARRATAQQRARGAHGPRRREREATSGVVARRRLRPPRQARARPHNIIILTRYNTTSGWHAAAECDLGDPGALVVLERSPRSRARGRAPWQPAPAAGCASVGLVSQAAASTYRGPGREPGRGRVRGSCQQGVTRSHPPHYPTHLPPYPGFQGWPTPAY
jgi:hypothetical protein